MYDQDLETETPPREWVEFRERIRRADALLFATPEYNDRFQGASRMRWTSDPGRRGRVCSTQSPAPIVSVTPYGLGAFGANHHLRQALVYVNVLTMAQPEAYMSQAGELVDAEFRITKDESRQFFTTFLNAFAAWIELTRKK